MQTVVVVVIVGVSLVVVTAFSVMIGYGVIFVVASGRVSGAIGVLIGLGVAAFVVFSYVRLIEIWRRDVSFGVRDRQLPVFR